MVSLVLLQACTGETEKANKLMVEASKLVQAAEGAQSAEEKLKLLDHASDKLNHIVERYPSTELAAKLAAGEPVGNMSSSKIREERIYICRASPVLSDVSCIAEYVSAIVEMIEDGPLRAEALAHLAKIQVKAGNIQKGQETIDMAIVEAEKIERDWNPVDALVSIAGTHAKTGNIQKGQETIAMALGVAEKAEYDFDRDITLCDIAQMVVTISE
jgi:hypothetical protein